MPISRSGNAPGYFCPCGVLGWQSMMRWKALPGSGRVLIRHQQKPPWRKRRWGQTPRIGEKAGTKGDVLVNGRGVPLPLVVTGANRHDVTQLESVLDGCVVQRPEIEEEDPQNLCADKGYDYPSARQAIANRGLIPHVRARGEEQRDKRTIPGYKARRWVVEVCHSWLNRYRKILIRFEKYDENHQGLLMFACAIVAWRRVASIYG